MNTFSAKPTFQDIRNFLAGRFVGSTRDEFFLDEIVKLIFCKNQLYANDTSEYSDIELAGLYRRQFKKVISEYPDIYEDSNTEIELDPISIKYIDNKLSSIDLINTERDVIGDAYEIFIGNTIKGQAGQFFTPQNAASALVKMIKPSPSDKILDLTCGAGGFLIAVHKYWNESNIQTTHDNLFGIDKDKYLTRLAKIHLACLGENPRNIICADSLVWNKEILGSGENAYDIILTNPPFGVNIQTGSEETLSKFELAYKHRKQKDGSYKKTDELNVNVAPQVVFLEQCIRIVKPGGYIGIVIPESMISNKKYIFIVDYLFKTCRIKAVIGMPEALFKTSGKGGTHTKTCLMVLEKQPNIDNSSKIFMAEAKWCGHDSRGRAIPKDDIPTITENYETYLTQNNVSNTNLGFLISSTDILDNNKVLAPRAYTFAINQNPSFAQTHILVPLKDLIAKGIIEISTGNEVGKLAYGTGEIPFVRTSDLSNWEIKSDPKHLLSDEIYQEFQDKQDVQEGDILMVKDGSYLIGTCAMITKYDTKMVYQSHLYKIRVKEPNEYSLNRYYLLALLSSEYLRQQIQSKTLSQDIIDSLGDRIKELILPISKDSNKIAQITTMVKTSITKNIEARELEKRARKEVLL